MTQATIFWTRTRKAKCHDWRGSLNPTMFQYARNVKIKGDAFTVVKEQNGMIGALNDSVVNWYFLTAIHAKVSRYYCIDESRTALPMTPLNTHPCHPDTCKTIIGDIVSWIGDPSRTSSVLWFNGPDIQARRQSSSHSDVRLQRNNAEFLIPAISFGLSIAIPDAGKIIDVVVANDPYIPTKGTWDTAAEADSWTTATSFGTIKATDRYCYRWNGLDECEGEDVQSNVLRLLSSIPTPLRWW